MSLDIEALYVQEHDRLYEYLRKRLPDRDQRAVAADLAADAFRHAWEKRHQYRPLPGAKPSSWLYRIARNLLMDYYRHRGRISFYRLEDIRASVMHVGTDGHVDLIDVASALSTYRTGNPAHAPDKQIAALRAYYFERGTDLEIGARLGMSKASVTKLRMRALANLRKMLEAA